MQITGKRNGNAWRGLFLGLLLAVLSPARGASLPPDCKVTGSAEPSESGNGLLAPAGEKKGGLSLQGPLSAETPVLVLKARTGPGKGLFVHLKGPDGQLGGLGINTPKPRDLADQDAFLGLAAGSWRGKYFVRPHASFYKPEEIKKRKTEWEKLPKASDSFFTLVFRPSGNETEVWLDGQLMNAFPTPKASESYQINLSPGAAVESLELKANAASSPLVLPVSQNPRVREMAAARLKFDAPVPPAFELLAGKEEAPGIGVGNLGVMPGLLTSWGQSYFWRRHASDHLPEQRMFSVPLAVYDRAWVLCAADPDPEKVSAFTLRVTRYADMRGNAMADTVVKVPASGSPDSADARRVGTVSYGPEGSRKTAPLWLLRVPIRNGWIPELLSGDTRKSPNVGTYRYLDVELLDPLLNAEAFMAFPPPMELVRRQWAPTDPALDGRDLFDKTNPPATSGVTVFGMELEKSPASLEVKTKPGVQAFYASEKPEFLAEIDAREPGNYLVKWAFADVSGKIVETGEKTAQCAAGVAQELAIPVRQGTGWYACRFELVGAEGRELMDYRTSFVMLPPDTRKAGYESPFFGWWYRKNQRSDVRLDEVGPLLQRAGIRRADLPESMPESLSQKYGFTASTVSWGRNKMLTDFQEGRVTLEQAIAAHEAKIKQAVELWPHIDRMLVFHESPPAGESFPAELWGEPAKNSPEFGNEASPAALAREEGVEAGDTKAKADGKKAWDKRIEYLTAMSQMVREKFPNLKMQYGNNGDSLAIMGEIFRRKFPRKWIDTVSVEDLGQTMPPERLLPGSLNSAWLLRETARKMGYGDVPVTACTEWIGRMTERLGLKTQAEWKVRDGLLALAYGFDTISIAGINDAGSGYYYSIWANGGLCGRWPMMAPKPAYAAVATLTQVLDRAKFRRFVPTGSAVLYLEEFQRDGEWVYPVWTPRGQREATLEFPDGDERSLVDLYGRTRSVKGASLRLEAGTGVQYLVSKTQLKAATAGKPSFPGEAAPAKPLAVIPLESTGEVSIVPNRGAENKARRGLPNRRSGKFELREVEDPEMGKCLEVELIPEGKISDLDQEYVTLKLKTPVPTGAHNAGLWIKGNGSWGQVDIQKKRNWGPWAGNGNRHLFWRGLATLNFDGWNFIEYPYYDWLRTDEPNEVQGLLITIPRKVLVGTEMMPVGNLKVRIKSIVLF